MAVNSSETLDQTEKPLPTPINELPPEQSLIRPQDLEDFRSVFCKTPEDEDILEKIIANIRIVTEEDFERGMEEMSQRILDFVGEDHYYLVVDRETSSGDLMISGLKLNDNPPLEVIRLSKFEKYELKEGTKVVIADDAGYSGQRLARVVSRARQYIRPDDEDIFVGAVSLSSTAFKTLEEKGVKNISYSYKIPMASDCLSPEELNIYKRRLEELESERWIENDVLSFHYYKVPDNFLGGLIRSKPIVSGDPLREFYLLDDSIEGIYPFYKRKT